jgi:hypothetical protein
MPISIAVFDMYEVSLHSETGLFSEMDFSSFCLILVPSFNEKKFVLSCIMDVNVISC